MKIKTISKKLNLILFITVISVLTISGFIIYKIYKEEMHNNMLNKLSRTQKRLELILPPILWDLQYDLAKDIVQVESIDDIIDIIIIKDIDNTNIAYINKLNKNLSSYGTHKQKFDIKYKNEVIATIYIAHNHNKINKLKNNIIINMIINITLILIILQLLFSFLVNKYIISNIQKLKKGIYSFATIKDFNEDIIINSQDEIYYLAEEFNNMKNNLKQSWEELNSLNHTLEDKVKKEIEINKKNQLHLFKSEKMAAMGEMIGNIAHQWRQPLSIIATSSTGMLMQREMDILTDDNFIKSCNMINDNAQYLSKTIDDFKNFIKGDREIEDIILKELIDKFINLIQPSINKTAINIILNIEDNVVFKGHPNELIQCFINIFNNSRDVLINLDENKRIIVIKATTTQEALIITFQDSAGGIKEDILSKIFEPYFTTKHKTQGTGLGLHMTYKLIVEGMKGKIVAQNKIFTFNKEKFKGALFTITLPYHK